MGKFFTITAFLFVVALGGMRLPAQILYVDNTSGSVIPHGFEFYGLNWLAQSFTTGTSPTGYLFNQSALTINSAGPSAPAFTVKLYSDSSSAPGTALSLLTTTDNATYKPASAIPLARLTTYWLVLSSVGGNPSNYNYVPGTFSAGSPSDGWSIPTHMFTSSNSGGSWADSIGAYTLFSVLATSAPEPSSYLLVGAGLAALFFVRARRRV